MKLLVCYDGSEESKAVLDYCKNFIAKDTELLLFGAYDKVHQPTAADVPEAIYVPPAEEWAENERARRERVAKYRLTQAKDVLNKAGFENVREIVVEAGDVRDAAEDVIEKEHVDACVVGTRGHNAIKRAFLGSLSTYLAHHAPCPVIIARTKAT